jgi:hypothetical protein
MSNDQNLARDYALAIRAEILALENVLNGSTYAASEAQAVEMKEILAEMVEQSGEDADDYTPNAVDYVNAYCLEFVEKGSRRDGEWTVDGVKILRSFGGPTCWIECDGTDNVTVSVGWGERENKRFYAPTVAAAFLELAGN